MSIIELIEAGNLDSRVAALFWVAMERGASLIVAADPPSSGKTTTLSALMAFTPPDTAVYFTRGMGETFALPPASRSYHTYIMVNEMSDHIPVYTWDDDARRAFELLAGGYRLGTTMHADTVEGVLGQLENDLSIPPAHVARLTFIVPMHIGQRGRTIRRIQEVAFIQPAGESYTISNAASWDPDGDSFTLLQDASTRETFAEWAGLSLDALDAEIKERSGFLDSLRETGVHEIPQVTAAIEGYYTRMQGSTARTTEG
jgi:hypothetical protein